MSSHPDTAGPTSAPDFAPWVSGEAKQLFADAVRGGDQAFTSLLEARAAYDVKNRAWLKTMQALFPVETTATILGGVAVDLVGPPLTPDAPVLICLHGGGFAWGAGAGALLEAVPIAAVSGITVVAVDYRMAPEHRHPAAIDDVVAVYKALLVDRPAARIGIYGCSAGAVLTAQTVAKLQALGEPRPGAVAMLHAAGVELGGDLLALSPLLTESKPDATLSGLSALPYFDGADATDPLVFPGEHPEVLKGFPPSLLITATRDFAASSVSVMHRRLLAAGVEADFILFDGLWHAFHMSSELPESRELYARVSEFFTRRLT
jgi:monoterpene epsilon-lactone hydrolase